MGPVLGRSRARARAALADSPAASPDASSREKANSREKEPARGQEAPASQRPTLIVNGHTDVVPALAARWEHDPFDPVVKDGRLYGRGGADMKGGVAAAICALGTLKAAGYERPCDIVFQFVADEERGGALGTRALMEKGLLRATPASCQNRPLSPYRSPSGVSCKVRSW